MVVAVAVAVVVVVTSLLTSAPVMLLVTFFSNTNRRSFSANGGVMRLCAVFATVALFVSSYAARSCCSPVLIYRQEKRNTCLVTVTVPYLRIDWLRSFCPLGQRYDNPTQEVMDQTGRRYVILVFRQIQYTSHLVTRMTNAGRIYCFFEGLLIQHGFRTIPNSIYVAYRGLHIIMATAAAAAAATN